MSGPNFQAPPPSEDTVIGNGKTRQESSDDDIYVTDEQPSKRAPMAAKPQAPVNANGIMVC
jgi:hypothetical protein